MWPSLPSDRESAEDQLPLNGSYSSAEMIGISLPDSALIPGPRRRLVG